jgi:hypothetical protein
MSLRLLSATTYLAACLTGPLLAVLLYAPTVDGTFLEDDVFTSRLVDAGQDEPQVDWASAFAEFGQPWGTDRGMFYRPLVTLSASIDYAIAGPSPRIFHITNITLHALASLFCALVCAAVCPAWRTKAALLGGMLFALHPAATEPVCWIAARTSSMAILFELAALAAFARYRLQGSRAALTLCALSCAAAYLSKEEAVVTPVLLLALDGILCVVQRTRMRFGAHLVLLPVWLAYWLMRYVALGDHWLGDGGVEPPLDVVTAIQNMLAKLGVILVPFMQQRWSGEELLLITCAAVVLLACLIERRARWILVICGAWAMVSVLPSLPYAQSPNLGGSRYVYGAVAAMAVLSVSTLGSRIAALRVGLPVVLVVWCLLLASVTLQRIGDYEDTFEGTRILRANLAHVIQDATPARPLVVMGAPPGRNGIPAIRASSLFALEERPLSRADYPLISLWFIFQPTLRSIGLWQDAGPLRAMQRMGAEIVGWSNSASAFEPLIPDGGPLVPLKLSTEDGHRFSFPGVISPERVESLRLEVRGGPTSGTLHWFARPRDGSGGQEALSEGTPFRGTWVDEGRAVFTINLFNDWDFLSSAYSGGLGGFLVELDQEGSSVESVTTAPRLEPLPLPTVFADQALVLREESSRLRAPKLPRQGLLMDLVLMGPDRGYTMRVEPGEPITFPDEIRLPLERATNFSRQNRYYYYFQTRNPLARSSPCARSEVDWFRLLRPGTPSPGGP